MHGKNGFLAHDNDEWYLYIKKLLDDKGLREKMGRKARLMAEKYYSYEKFIPNFLNFIRSLSANKEIISKFSGSIAD
jgi:glycosyltransferase involved in cell wall biosynthesis